MSKEYPDLFLLFLIVSSGSMRRMYSRYPVAVRTDRRIHVLHINKDKLIEALHHGRNANSYRHTVEYYSAVKMNEPQKQAIMAELVVAMLTNHNKLSGLNNHYLFNAQLNKW